MTGSEKALSIAAAHEIGHVVLAWAGDIKPHHPDGHHRDRSGIAT